MPYEALVHKVMIASPNDVPTERNNIREAIHEWNSIHSEDRGIVLMPVGWETHSSPDMGARAQEIVNEQVLKDCDLLIAVFWTRLGSPTGSSPSGTVEEIREHLAAGKPAMIYFSSQPVQLDSVDQDQYQALRAFKKECQAMGLVEEYETPAEFKSKLGRQLAQTVIRSLIGRIDDEGSPSVADLLRTVPEEWREEFFPTKPLEGPDVVARLSVPAKDLLLEASKDADGAILRFSTMGGLEIRTNGKNFITENTPRLEAKWQDALQQLQSSFLVEDRSHKGEVFYVTQEGFHVADRLANNQKDVV